nr:MFS transporter [Salinirubrum litoreum]
MIALSATSRFGSGALMGTALAVYIGEIGSPFAVSLVFPAYFVGLMLFAPVWGAVADVTGRRRAVLVGTGVGATLAVLPLTLVGGIYAPIGLRALYAAFAAGFSPVMLAVASQRGGDEGRGREVGFFNSARAMGFTAGQLTVGALLGLLVPDALYLVIAGISLVSTVTVALVADPAAGSDSGPAADEDVSLSAVVAAVRRRLLPSVGERAHLRQNGLRWLYVALALRNMTVLGVMSLMPVFLTDRLGLSAFWMGVVLAINPGGQVVCMYLFGRVADAVGRKSLIVGGMGGSAAFALVAASATLPASQVTRLAVAAGAFVLIAAAFSAMTTGALAFIGDVAPTNRESELMGLRDTAKGVGGVFGPPLLGGLATVASYETAFAAGSVLALTATVLVGGALVETRTVGGGLAASSD